MPISKIKGNAIEDDAITSARLDDGTIVAVDLASDSVTTAKIQDSAVTLDKLSATGTKDATTFLRGDNTFQEVAVTPTAVSDQPNTSTGGFSLPAGTTAQRPGSPDTGETRFNSETGSLEFYDGTQWVATNLIPTIDSVSGTIYAGATSNLTLTLTNATNSIDVVFSEGGSAIATVSDISVSSGSATVSVPAAVYGQTAGDTIAISINNNDGTPSSNAPTVTVTALPSGGTITTSGNYRIHTFTSSGTFTNTISNLSVEYLVIAGGGGGGTDNYSQDRGAGGGGAGGYRNSTGSETSGGGGSTESTLTLSTGNKTVTVGAGGAGATTAELGVTGANGSDSVFDTITSIGGGGGQGHNSTGAYPGTPPTGGSGGGGSNSQPGGSGTSNQGYRGGNGATAPFNGGGGGGAGAQGQDATTTYAGEGGSGLSSSITGSAVIRAGGGGGRGGSNNTTPGGSGGGGTGQNGGSGTANTGSGGGAIRGTNAGSGGSGIVIVRYDTTAI